MKSINLIDSFCSAIQTCHAQNVVHRDIKPENLLLTSDEQLLLADFGWSSHNVTHHNRRETLCGTLDYLSPEMVQGTPYDTSVDIWAIGVTLYEFLCGKPPFEAHVSPFLIQLVMKIKTQSVVLGSESDCESDY